MTLKHYLIPILLILAAVPLHAQQISISGFSRLTACDNALSEPGGVVGGPNGEPCALLVLSTREKGWTFDAGLAGIADIAYAEDEIRLWVGSEARHLTVSHPVYGVLRDWTLPVTLERGGTYQMRLEHVNPAPVRTASGSRTGGTVTPSLPAGTSRRVSSRPGSTGYTSSVPSVQLVPSRPDVTPGKGLCHHFIDAYLGFVQEEYEYGETFFGMRYTYLGGRIGPYVAAAVSDDESWSLTGGLTLRLGSGRDNPDWQLYGGAGLVDGCALAGEAGVRIGWLSEGRVSRWDFGAGCQFWEGTLMPTVEVGLCIWGIPVVIGLGLCLGAI